MEKKKIIEGEVCQQGSWFEFPLDTNPEDACHDLGHRYGREVGIAAELALRNYHIHNRRPIGGQIVFGASLPSETLEPHTRSRHSEMGVSVGPHAFVNEEQGRMTVYVSGPNSNADGVGYWYKEE